MADPSDDEESGAHEPFSGAIEEVAGRIAGGADGLPAIDRVRITMDSDGSVFEALRSPPETGEPRTAKLVAEIPSACFSGCPICFDPKPLTEEHVPNRKLGGKAMVNTCDACNNGLGSRLEASLTHWYDEAMPGVVFTSDAVRGRRRSSPILRLATPSGELVLMPLAGHDAAVGDIIRSGEFTLEFEQVDYRACQFAAMKSAYLAACNLLGGIPRSDSAERIRGALVATRDTKLREALPESPDADRMLLHKTYRPPHGPTLALMAVPREGNDPQEFLVSLAGTVLVSWPFDDLSPIVPRQR